MEKFQGYNKLNTKEKKFLTLLEGVDKESLWGIAVTNVIANPSVFKVRKLICELKSQAHDCEPVMKSVLGEPGLKQLLAM